MVVVVAESVAVDVVRAVAVVVSVAVWNAVVRAVVESVVVGVVVSAEVTVTVTALALVVLEQPLPLLPQTDWAVWPRADDPAARGMASSTPAASPIRWARRIRTPFPPRLGRIPDHGDEGRRSGRYTVRRAEATTGVSPLSSHRGDGEGSGHGPGRPAAAIDAR